MTMKRRIKIGGQDFDPVTTSTIARRGKLDELRQQPNENVVQYSTRVHRALVDGGVILPLVAAQITPAGRPWDADLAVHTVLHLRKVCSARDKETVLDLMGKALAELLQTDVVERWSGAEDGSAQ
jgi:hypothetical protein